MIMQLLCNGQGLGGDDCMNATDLVANFPAYLGNPDLNESLSLTYFLFFAVVFP